MPKHAKNRKNTIQNAKKVIKMSPVTVFTQSPGYNVIFCVFEKGANNILFSIPPYPQKEPPKTPPPVWPARDPKTGPFDPPKCPPWDVLDACSKKKTPFFQKLTFFFSPYVDFAIIT